MRQPSPAAIDMLVQLFRPARDYKEFLKLIREYLPDREQDIMELTSVSDRMQLFGEIFSNIYFPLWTDWLGADEENDYDKLTNRCPAVPCALSSVDYDEMAGDDDKAEIVIAYVLENPWATADRAAFAEAAARHIPEKLLRMIPEEGFELEKLEEALHGTGFEPVAFWGRALSQQTENYFFDAGDIEDTGTEFVVHWNRGTIDELTRHWQAYEAWQETWSNFKEWFLKDLNKNTYDLIKILTERRKDDGGEIPSYQEAYPEYDPRQGRLFDLEPHGA